MNKYLIRWSFYGLAMIGMVIVALVSDPTVLALILPLFLMIFMVENCQND